MLNQDCSNTVALNQEKMATKDVYFAIFFLGSSGKRESATFVRVLSTSMDTK